MVVILLDCSSQGLYQFILQPLMYESTYTCSRSVILRIFWIFTSLFFISLIKFCALLWLCLTFWVMKPNRRLKNFLLSIPLAKSLKFCYALFLFSFSSKNFLTSLCSFFKDFYWDLGFCFIPSEGLVYAFASCLWTLVIRNHISYFIF